MPPWKTQTAEEIIGMKPDELKAKLDSAATKDDVTNAVKPLQEQMTGALAELQQALQALKTPKVEPVVDDSDPAVRMLADPKAFVADETRGLHATQLETQAQLNEIQARQNPEFSGVFAQYGAELSALVAKIPVAQRAQQHFWASCIRTFLGEQIIKGKLRSNFPSLLGTSSVVRGADGEPDDPNFGFDPDMAEYFKKRGKNLKEMAFIRDKSLRDGERLNAELWKGKPH